MTLWCRNKLVASSLWLLFPKPLPLRRPIIPKLPRLPAWPLNSIMMSTASVINRALSSTAVCWPRAVGRWSPVVLALVALSAVRPCLAATYCHPPEGSRMKAQHYYQAKRKHERRNTASEKISRYKNTPSGFLAGTAAQAVERDMQWWPTTGEVLHPGPTCCNLITRAAAAADAGPGA